MFSKSTNLRQYDRVEICCNCYDTFILAKFWYNLAGFSFETFAEKGEMKMGPQKANITVRLLKV